MGDKAQASRDAILDAAGRILVRDGGDALTIASVAREAGISKGGLFYHFASKKALVEGLVARHVSAFEELITAAGRNPVLQRRPTCVRLNTLTGRLRSRWQRCSPRPWPAPRHWSPCVNAMPIGRHGSTGTAFPHGLPPLSDSPSTVSGWPTCWDSLQ